MAVKKTPEGDLSKKIDTIGKKLDSLITVVVGHDKKFESIDKKFESIDKRFDSIDNRFDYIDKKFESTDSKIDRIIEVMATKNELRAVEERLAEVEHTVTHIATATDGMVGTYDTLHVEYVAIKMQLSRYDRWFEELSKKTGVKLEY